MFLWRRCSASIKTKDDVPIEYVIISPSAFQVIEEGLNNNAQWVDPYKPEEQLQNIPYIRSIFLLFIIICCLSFVC